MKRVELTKEVKAELWRIFDSGHTVANITINGQKLPAEAIEKQRRLWEEYRKRNPLKKAASAPGGYASTGLSTRSA